MTAPKKSSHKNAARSRQMIKKAFAELLNEKDMGKITVTDIVERAGISRGTFYAHYLDVYDLYMAIQANMMETIDEGISAVGAPSIIVDPTMAIKAGITFIAEKKPYYKLFVTSSRSTEFINRMASYIIEKLSCEAENIFEGEDINTYKLFLQYTLGAIQSVVVKWIDEEINISTDELIVFLADIYSKSKPDIVNKVNITEE